MSNRFAKRDRALNESRYGGARYVEEGAATYIVSGDDDLLALNPYQGISIITSRRFVEIVVRADQ